MKRQFFCWKVNLTYRCGCVEATQVTHRCGPDREGCNSWSTNKRTDKNCAEHRSPGWGLQTEVQTQTQTSDAASMAGEMDMGESGSEGASDAWGSQREGEGEQAATWEGSYAPRRRA